MSISSPASRLAVARPASPACRSGHRLRWLFKLALLLAAAATLFAADSEAQVISFGMRKIAYSTNQFGLDLLRASDKSDARLAFCPFCISSSLVMLLMGSRGPTADSLRHALYLYGMSDSEINFAYFDMMNHLGVNLPSQKGSVNGRHFHPLAASLLPPPVASQPAYPGLAPAFPPAVLQPALADAGAAVYHHQAHHQPVGVGAAQLHHHQPLPNGYASLSYPSSYYAYDKTGGSGAASYSAYPPVYPPSYPPAYPGARQQPNSADAGFALASPEVPLPGEAQAQFHQEPLVRHPTASLFVYENPLVPMRGAAAAAAAQAAESPARVYTGFRNFYSDLSSPAESAAPFTNPLESNPPSRQPAARVARSFIEHPLDPLSGDRTALASAPNSVYRGAGSSMSPAQAPFSGYSGQALSLNPLAPYAQQSNGAHPLDAGAYSAANKGYQPSQTYEPSQTYQLNQVSQQSRPYQPMSDQRSSYQPTDEFGGQPSVAAWNYASVDHQPNAHQTNLYQTNSYPPSIYQQHAYQPMAFESPASPESPTPLSPAGRAFAGGFFSRRTPVQHQQAQINQPIQSPPQSTYQRPLFAQPAYSALFSGRRPTSQPIHQHPARTQPNRPTIAQPAKHGRPTGFVNLPQNQAFKQQLAGRPAISFTTAGGSAGIKPSATAGNLAASGLQSANQPASASAVGGFADAGARPLTDTRPAGLPIPAAAAAFTHVAAHSAGLSPVSLHAAAARPPAPAQPSPAAFDSSWSTELTGQSNHSDISFLSNMYVQRDFAINYRYHLLLQKFYKTPIHPLDFVHNGEETRQHINAIVQMQTDDKIHDILDSRPSPATQLLLISALYFNGQLDLAPVGQQARAASAQPAALAAAASVASASISVAPAPPAPGSAGSAAAAAAALSSAAAAGPASTTGSSSIAMESEQATGNRAEPLLAAETGRASANSAGGSPGNGSVGSFGSFGSDWSWLQSAQTRLRYSFNRYLNCSTVEMPLRGALISFVVMMPSEPTGLDTLLTRLNAQMLNDVINSLEIRRMSIKMPKMSFESRHRNLSITLSNLGLADLFKPGVSHLHEISDFKWLYVSDIVHKTHVDIRMPGGSASARPAAPSWSAGSPASSAAAAPAVSAGSNGSPEAAHPPTELVIDKPFLFFVMDSVSGLIISMGKIGREPVHYRLPI